MKLKDATAYEHWQGNAKQAKFGKCAGCHDFVWVIRQNRARKFLCFTCWDATR